jgi:DeoR/GlpR family transcriptional regulator of sugar metabolism
VAGVTERGFYNSNLLLVETEQALMRAADDVIVVADSTKFGRRSLAHLCELGDVQRIVVDADITDDWRAQIERSGVELLIASAVPN